jgi:hypothetical protein
VIAVHLVFRRRSIVIIAGTLLALAGLALAVASLFTAHAAPDAMAIPHSVPGAVTGARQTGSVPVSQRMTLTLALRSRNRAGLERFVRDVSTPQSGAFHQFITPAQFALAFGADPAELRAVERFAQQNGLRVAQVRSGGLFVTLTGSASQVARAFHVKLSQFRSSSGQAFFANTGNYSLPNAIAPGVASVTGLDNAPTLHNHVAGTRALKKTGPHANSCPATQGTLGLTPTQLATAYQFPSDENGSGRSLALVEFDGYSASDISVYTGCFATGVNVGNAVHTRLVDLSSALAPGSGAIEDELDIEIALGMAPGLSRVDVYEAPNTNQGLIDMMAAIANDDSDGSISDSWGSCESDAGFSVAQAEEMSFLQMAAQGQDVFVAAGDNGAYDCLNDLGSSPYFHGQTVATDDPASDPYVVAVGGTNLSQNASTSAYIGESVWNNATGSSPQLAGGGGGISTFWAAPTWQSSSKASQSNSNISNPASARLVPDVTADADPQTGYAEYCTVGSTCAQISGWFDVGGTSASSPLWAALSALAEQKVGARIGLITPALYALYGADTGASHAVATGIALGGTTYYDYASQVNGATASGAIVFHDVATGDNTFPSSQGFQPGFSAGTGYDAASGLGSMQATTVVNYLANAIRFTAPRMYLAAQGKNGGLWLSGFFLNNGDGNLVPDATTGSGWLSLGSQGFLGAPALTDNGIATAALSGPTALIYIAGVGTDNQARYGIWNPATMTFSGWTVIPGSPSCLGSPAAAFAQSYLFVSCMTTSGAVVLDALNTTSSTWNGWATIGGGLTSPPTMATDGTNLLILAQAPTKTSQQDWYLLYTVSSGAVTVWKPFNTTCEATPAVAYNGAAAGTYSLSCIASDTSTMWVNSFDASSGALNGWVQFGAPGNKIGFQNATSVTEDLAGSTPVIFLTGEGADGAAYVTILTVDLNYAQVADLWQRVSLPGIFSSNAATDYAGA